MGRGCSVSVTGCRCRSGRRGHEQLAYRDPSVARGCRRRAAQMGRPGPGLSRATPPTGGDKYQMTSEARRELLAEAVSWLAQS